MRQFNSSAWAMAALLGVACGPIGGPASGGASSVGGAMNVGGAPAGSGGSGGLVKCGAAVCRQGEYCCNASCSQCAPKGQACTLMACTGTGGAGAGVCASDSDCRLYDDYCKGCNCRAVPANIAVDPACGPQDMVQCLVEPCLNKRAVCVDGHCSAAGG